MKAPKSLRRPSNWQDFESLCKKLWGEIWQCAEIKKNGRSGQAQNGVDIYGIPSGEDSYFGIQCKGKNEYSNTKFSKQEIDNELEKAEQFQPKLKKLYLTTTAEKDAKTEEYVRKKNLESKEKNNFEIHLFSWEDIVDLIEENPKTYKYFVESQNFAELESIKVSFKDDLDKLNMEPIYIKRYLQVNQKIVTPGNFIERRANFTGQGGGIVSSKVNYSIVPFQIQILNTGNRQIDNFKMSLEIEGNISGIYDTNYISGIQSVIESKPINIVDKQSLTLNPTQKELVPEEVFLSDKIFIKAPNEKSVLKIHWRFISKTFKTNGELTANWNPIVKTVNDVKLEQDPLKLGSFEYPIADYIKEEK